MSEELMDIDQLQNTYMNGFADEETGNVDSPVNHAYRVGRQVVTTDQLGFVRREDFETENEAKVYLRELDDEYSEWLGDDEP